MLRLLIVCCLTAFIHFINTLIYSVRLSGVRTKRLAIALSLFNFIFMFSSMANTIQAPVLSTIIESAINEGFNQAGGLVSNAELLSSPFYQQQQEFVLQQLRIVVLAATGGTVLGALLIPKFVNVFVQGIYLFEEIKSIPRLLLLLLNPRKLKRVRASLPERKPEAPKESYKFNGLPKTFLVLNVLITGIYTIGVLASLYAGVLMPDYRSTATLMASVVNGLATVLFAMVVDPTAAMITDQALQGDRSEKDVKDMARYLSLTRIGGNVLAQFLLVPAAYVVVGVAKLII